MHISWESGDDRYALVPELRGNARDGFTETGSYCLYENFEKVQTGIESVDVAP